MKPVDDDVIWHMEDENIFFEVDQMLGMFFILIYFPGKINKDIIESFVSE